MTKRRFFPFAVSAGAVLATAVPFHLAAATAAAEPTAAIAVVNRLGARLQPILADQQTDANSNLVFSPASIGIALTMTSAGANGDTLMEMNEVLGIAGPDIHESMGALAALLTAGVDGSFTLANSLWVQDGFALEEPFVTTLTNAYRSQPFREDFASDPAGAVDDINKWVADATSDRITDLVGEGDITALTRLVLANAVFLQADWLRPFDPTNTGPDVFTRGDDSRVETDFMHQTLHADYAEGDGFQAVVLPYTNGYEMVVVLPESGGLEAFERALAEVGGLGAVLGPLADREVVLSLPTWDIETSADLVAPLQSMGMTLPFDPDQADFTNISTEEPLAINGVVHQADITVDEAGTEAAAATAVIAVAGAAPIGSLPEPVELKVDRSFFFAIRHTESGTVVFQGHVNDPAVAAGFG
jgi:serpin B